MGRRRCSQSLGKHAMPDVVAATDGAYRAAKAGRQLVTVAYRAVGSLFAPPAGVLVGSMTTHSARLEACAPATVQEALRRRFPDAALWCRPLHPRWCTGADDPSATTSGAG